MFKDIYTYLSSYTITYQSYREEIQLATDFIIPFNEELAPTCLKRITG